MTQPEAKRTRIVGRTCRKATCIDCLGTFCLSDMWGHSRSNDLRCQKCYRLAEAKGLTGESLKTYNLNGVEVSKEEFVAGGGKV